MKPATIGVLALCASLVLSMPLIIGCAGVRAPAAGVDAAGTSGAEGRLSAEETLNLAEAQYHRALAHYVCDEWDEAVPLLKAALSSIDSVDPADGDERHTRESLRARILYFLDAAPDGTRTAAAVPVDSGSADTPSASTDVTFANRDAGGARIQIVTNSRVEHWLQYFKGKGRREMTRWLARTGRYRPMIEGILAEEGLPQELFYLAMIESGLNPNAYSRAHAAGMWQFISSRARMYDLRVDWWVDERRDPEKATRAACAYLKDLYEMFGSWELALAGYNSGEGRVSRAQRKRPSCEDYWCLDLPRETENFVPKFMAAVMIGSDPEAYGFEIAVLEPPLEYESFEVSHATDIQLIADAAGVASSEIERLNPALRRWCTPSSETAVTVRVPPGTSRLCQAAIASTPEEERVTWTRHKVSQGETLSGIASAYGTSVRAILSVNDIRNPNRIRAGSHLIIPVGPGSLGEAYAAAGGTLTHRVRRGDTVSSIARRYGKRTEDVLRWNGLGWKTRIYPGDAITIRNM
jgi:membrane-bound lytic murein transglycosylase D